jgi:hypothetical protein
VGGAVENVDDDLRVDIHRTAGVLGESRKPKRTMLADDIWNES